MLQWGGMVSAAAVAGIMMFAVVTAPESTSFPGSQSLFVANAARRAVPPVDEARGLPAEDSSTYSAPQSYHPPLGWFALLGPCVADSRGTNQDSLEPLAESRSSQ